MFFILFAQSDSECQACAMLGFKQVSLLSPKVAIFPRRGQKHSQTPCIT